MGDDDDDAESLTPGCVCLYSMRLDALSLIYCTFSLWPWCLVVEFFVLTTAPAPNHNQPTHLAAHLL